MSLNRYSQLIPIFSNLNHGCSKQLITKLFDILYWFKNDLSYDLYPYVVILMFKTSIIDIEQFCHTKLPVYAYDETIHLFLPISNFSYNFQVVFEKHNNNWITHNLGQQVLNCITRMNYGGDSRRYRHFTDYEHKLTRKTTEEPNTLFKSLYNMYVELCNLYNNSSNIHILYIDSFKIPVYVVLITANNDVDLIICCLYKTDDLSNDDILNIQKHAVTSFIRNNLYNDEIELLMNKYPKLSYHIGIARFFRYS